MSADRDLAEAIHHEIISPESVEAAVNVWNDQAHLMSRQQRMAFVLQAAAAHAIDAVLAHRQSEAARTGPWDGGATEEEWRSRLASQCGQTLAARHERDEALRKLAETTAARTWGDYEEEDGYPGSLVPRKRGTP